MTDQTRTIIMTVIKSDPTVTEDERRSIKEALQGKAGGDELSRLLNASEACKLLGCCRKTLYTYEQKGQIRAIRHSKRHLRYPLADVKRLMSVGVTENAEQ